jgi:hypothetical protein
MNTQLIDSGLEIELAYKKGKAKFRHPTVLDLKKASGIPGAVLPNNVPSPDMCLELGRLTLESWGEASEMPVDDELLARDRNALVKKVLIFLGTMADCAKERGYKVIEGSDHRELVQIQLTDKTIVVLREQTASELRAGEKIANGVEQNASMIINSVVTWGGEEVVWYDLLAVVDNLKAIDFYLLGNGLQYFL